MKLSEIRLFLSGDIVFPKNGKILKNNSVLLPSWLINQVAQNKKIRLSWTQTKIFQQVQMEIAQNFDKIMPNIMPFESAKNSLLLPSPDFTKNVFTKFSPFCFLQVLSLSLPVYETQNIIIMEPNKQLRSGFLYVMPNSIYFALIKRISVLSVHFPQKTYFKPCNARRAPWKNWWFFMIHRACHPTWKG